MMAANACRGGMGLRPPPLRRLYTRSFERSLCGMSGSAFAHNASDISHVFMLAIGVFFSHFSFVLARFYLRISS